MGFATACVLSYERPDFLRESLEKMIFHADYPLEIIVHDDGSRDPRVHELLHRLLQQGKISTVISNPPGHNQGQGVALNRMFSIARGDPIIKIDQDLVFKPGWLRRVNEILDADVQVVAPVEHKRIGLLGLFHYHHEPVDSAKTLIERRHHLGYEVHTHICGSGFALTRDAWDVLGPFEEHSEAFAEDWSMQQAVTASDFVVCALPTEDLVNNQGFGVGPSTVVVDHDHNIQTIHKEPVIHAR